MEELGEVAGRVSQNPMHMCVMPQRMHVLQKLGQVERKVLQPSELTPSSFRVNTSVRSWDRQPEILHL